MPINLNSANAIKDSIKVFQSQKDALTAKINTMQAEIDVLVGKKQNLQSQASDIQSKITAMGVDVVSGGYQL